MGNYEYEITPAEVTGFTVVSCKDTRTDIVTRTILASGERSFPGGVAYVGARFSRDRNGLRSIMEKVETSRVRRKTDPEEKLAGIVLGLKHQSPGGMAHIITAEEGVSIIDASAMFRKTVLHDGQESSTRYIEFAEGNNLPELATLLPEGCGVPEELVNDYFSLQNEALGNYKKWFRPVYEQFKEHFQVDVSNKDEEGALSARTFDTVRGFLLSGFKTSLVYVTNATTMQQLLGELGAGRLPGEKHLYNSLLALLRPDSEVAGYVPEIKGLLNHVEPNMRSREEQQKLEDYFQTLPGYKKLLNKRRSFSGLVENICTLLPAELGAADRVAAQQLLSLHPALRMEDVSRYVKGLSGDQMAQIGNILFAERNRFYMPSTASAGGPIGLDMQIDYGIERDLGRHRAWERFSVVHETYFGFGEVGETGFTQAAYLRQIPEFKELQQKMEKDMIRFYEHRKEFLDKLSRSVGREAADKVGMYLLPLAHQVEMVIHGDIQKMVHLQDMRIREGAHIDARLVVARANEQVAKSDPLYRSLLYPERRVLVNNRDQFIRRD